MAKQKSPEAKTQSNFQFRFDVAISMNTLNNDPINEEVVNSAVEAVKNQVSNQLNRMVRVVSKLETGDMLTHLTQAVTIIEDSEETELARQKNAFIYGKSVKVETSGEAKPEEVDNENSEEGA